MSETKHELDAPPWTRVESTLIATAGAIRQAYDIRLAELELNLSQASLLALVLERGPSTQPQLADRLGLGRAATGAVIDVLERRELVERQPDPSDRRVWLVAVTQTGKEVTEGVHRVDRILRKELRAGISREDRLQLAHLLLRLQSNLARVLD